MSEQFSNPRTIRRLAPKYAATAAVYSGDEQVGYGVVTNLSEAGACIVTDSRLAPGSDLRLKVSFYEQPRLFETIARVVWTQEKASDGAGLAGLRLYGLRFTVTSTAERSHLLHVLQRKDSFVTVFQPTITEFDRMQTSLAGELDALGDKLGKNIGREPA
jgi:hypothetical protein